MPFRNRTRVEFVALANPASGAEALKEKEAFRKLLALRWQRCATPTAFELWLAFAIPALAKNARTGHPLFGDASENQKFGPSGCVRELSVTKAPYRKHRKCVWISALGSWGCGGGEKKGAGLWKSLWN